MKELNNFEIQSVSGGAKCDNDGYNLSFVVGNTLTVGVLASVFFGVPFTTGAMVGASYATAMMGAKLADSYLFPAPEASSSKVTFEA